MTLKAEELIVTEYWSLKLGETINIEEDNLENLPSPCLEVELMDQFSIALKNFKTTTKPKLSLGNSDGFNVK